MHDPGPITILGRTSLLAALAVGLTAAVACGASNLSDIVKPRQSYPGMLRASEVCMRSLVPRTASDKSPHDTLQAIKDFHVTRLEWTYSLTPEFIARVKALGCTVSGAAANGSILGLDRKQPDWFLPYSILNLNGEAVEAPWMRPWPGHTLWDCANNPKSRAGYLAYVKNLVDMGVQDIQRDDPSMNVNAANWGACFCPYCMAGFRDYLRLKGDREKLKAAGVGDLVTFDYGTYLRERKAPVGDDFARYPMDYLKEQFLRFQEEATLQFHRWWRAELNKHAGRYVPVSANNGVTNFSPVYQLFDYFIGELSYGNAQPETLHEAMAQAISLGKGITVTMPLRGDPQETPDWTRRIRQTIATCYALGMHIEAPWDTYLPIVAANPARYFGKPEDSADLFALVRAVPELLDGYEEAAVTGGLLDEKRWLPETRPVTAWAASDRVYAFTRTQPAKRSAPVVVHLVDWSDTPEPFSVSLNPDSLFGGRPFSVALVIPQPYDRAAHQAACESGDYSALVQETSLTSGPMTVVEVPPLKPWGLLVLTPLPAASVLWPPHATRAEVAGKPAVAFSTITDLATIRYTADGTDPGPNSPAYKTPLVTEGLKELRARSYRAGHASAVVRIAHPPRPQEGWQEALVNPDFLQGTSGWLKSIAQGLPADALQFDVAPLRELGGKPAARLHVNASNGVPYHVRLRQPVEIPAGAEVYLRATLLADRPARLRIGVQEATEPYRVVQVRVVDVTAEPRRVLMSTINNHPGLKAQFQLDLGYVEPGTTVWMTDVHLRIRPKAAP